MSSLPKMKTFAQVGEKVYRVYKNDRNKFYYIKRVKSRNGSVSTKKVLVKNQQSVYRARSKNPKKKNIKRVENKCTNTKKKSNCQSDSSCQWTKSKTTKCRSRKSPTGHGSPKRVVNTCTMTRRKNNCQDNQNCQWTKSKTTKCRSRKGRKMHHDDRSLVESDSQSIE